MNKSEIKHSNKRQREVFGFSDEDLERERKSDMMWTIAALILGIVVIGYFLIHMMSYYFYVTQ